jgi:hypothetical protein
MRIPTAQIAFKAGTRMAEIKVQLKVGDVFDEPADVFVVKYAQALNGVDQAVAGKLHESLRRIEFPRAWESHLEDSAPGIAASRILFVGVPPLDEFGYREVRRFARTALSVLAKKEPLVKRIALTIHGVLFGLDEAEAFEAEIAGLVDAVSVNDCPEALREIIIVERDHGRVARLMKSLTALLPERTISTDARSTQFAGTVAAQKLRAAGLDSEAKSRAFVAMPFKDDMDDVYHYGIQTAINAAGLLSERADISSFTGDILEWVKSRICTAKLVVADLTDANPNVYLEVGYAWGVGVPTVLIVRGADHLKFDVRGQRCLTYKKIKDLEASLTSELKSLRVGD